MLGGEFPDDRGGCGGRAKKQPKLWRREAPQEFPRCGVVERREIKRDTEESRSRRAGLATVMEGLQSLTERSEVHLILVMEI